MFTKAFSNEIQKRACIGDPLERELSTIKSCIQYLVVEINGNFADK
jgi:hypothetical protein